MMLIALPFGSVAMEPRVTLCAWSAFICLLPSHNGVPTLHLVGWRVETSRGRTSSPVLTIDCQTRRCLTSSGTVYQLAGTPGMNADALAAWGTFRVRNALAKEVDVTEALWQAFVGGVQ